MRFLAVVVLLAHSTAHADTFTVDDDGPADFAQVTDALASPLVEDGDVLLVEPGDYQFKVDGRSITLVGTGASPGEVRFLGGIAFNQFGIRNLAADQVVAITNAALLTWPVVKCEGTVVLTEVEGILLMDRSLDCRIEGSDFESVSVTSSRAEFSRCQSQSTLGISNGSSGTGESSFVHFAQSVASGSDGANAGIFSGAQDGSPGVRVRGSVLVVSGPGSVLRGGDGGFGDTIPFDGDGGAGIQIGCASFGATPGGTVRYSGVALLPGKTPCTGVLAPAIESCGTVSVNTPTLPDPSLERASPIVAGQTLELQTHAVDQAFVMTWVGRPHVFEPHFQAVGRQSVAIRAQIGQGYAVGAVLSAFLDLPASLAPGTVLHFQSLAIYPDGTARFTNSVPAVVRL